MKSRAMNLFGNFGPKMIVILRKRLLVRVTRLLPTKIGGNGKFLT
jgi:hypothetical protein